MEFTGHAYLCTGTLGDWQPRLASFLQAFEPPDVLRLERSGESWRIEEVRRLIVWAWRKPYAGLRKVALLDEAERLTPEAADAFLKTLEEPPASTVFFLFSRLPRVLPTTIRSRMLRLGAVSVPEAVADEHRAEFLALFGLSARERLAAAERYAAEPAELETHLTRWLLVLRECLIGETPLPALDPARARILMAHLLNLSRLLRETNAQPRLLLDSFFLLW